MSLSLPAILRRALPGAAAAVLALSAQVAPAQQPQLEDVLRTMRAAQARGIDVDAARNAASAAGVAVDEPASTSRPL